MKSQALGGSFQVYVIAEKETLEVCESALTREIRLLRTYDDFVETHEGPVVVRIEA